LVKDGWKVLEERLGIDLEQTSRETKAIERLRKIGQARDLLRLILAYALSDWSLRLIAGWANLAGIGDLSDVAVLKRIKKARHWIGSLIAELLQRRCSAFQSLPGVRLRLMDATTVSAPGSQGADWRTHLCFDLGNMCLDGLELTDGLGGETLQRFEPQTNEIRIVDGGYPSAKGMGPLLAKQAGIIVRINWRNVAVRTVENQRVDIIAWLKTILGPAEQSVRLQTPQGWFDLRLLACPLPPEKGAEARRKVRQRNDKKGHQVSRTTLFAAGFVMLLTNLPADPWSTTRVLTLYRLRWQVELVFKRLKSLLHFDHLRAKDPELAQTYLLAKLLSALLLEEMTQDLHLYQPDWFLSVDRPLNPSRLTQLELSILFQLVLGPWQLDQLPTLLAPLRRSLCDPPRARPQQLAWARALAQHWAYSPRSL
jgi:hypothetical protein